MDKRWIAPAVLIVTGWIGFASLLGGGSPLGMLGLTVAGESRFTHVTPGESLDVRLRGDVEFTDDDRDVASLSPDGRILIRHRKGLHRRSLEIEPDGRGGHSYAYRFGRREKPFDEDARAWLGGLLPRIIRESGIGAEARVARILERDGLDGVLREIAEIESGSAATVYCREALEQGAPDTTGLRRIARTCSDGIAGSGDKARFLIGAAREYLRDDEAAEAFFDAADSVPGSGDRSRVLLEALDRAPLSPGIQARLLESAAGVPGSGDRARVLIRAAREHGGDPGIRRAFFDAADSVPSSGDHARVLIALLAEGGLDAESLAAACASARRIGGSGDRSRVLLEVARSWDNAATVREACFDAVDSIPAAGDHARVLIALLGGGRLDRDAVLRLLDSARGISGSGDRTRVLLEAVDHVARDESLRRAYLEVAGGIASAGDRDRARSALLDL